MCHSPWGPKELDTMKRLNNNNKFCINERDAIVTIFSQGINREKHLEHSILRAKVK